MVTEDSDLFELVDLRLKAAVFHFLHYCAYFATEFQQCYHGLKESIYFCADSAKVLFDCINRSTCRMKNDSLGETKGTTIHHFLFHASRYSHIEYPPKVPRVDVLLESVKGYIIIYFPLTWIFPRLLSFKFSLGLFSIWASLGHCLLKILFSLVFPLVENVVLSSLVSAAQIKRNIFCAAHLMRKPKTCSLA